MTKLWDTFGYFKWKYSSNFFALCGGNQYIWIYKNRIGLIAEMSRNERLYNSRGLSSGYSSYIVYEMHGPCGIIVI